MRQLGSLVNESKAEGEAAGIETSYITEKDIRESTDRCKREGETSRAKQSFRESMEKKKEAAKIAAAKRVEALYDYAISM